MILDTSDRREEFLSEEDLDLQNLSQEELITYWNLWLEQAQITNSEDADSYSHAAFSFLPFNQPTERQL